LLTIDGFKGVPPEKFTRLHAAAQAALEGWLARDCLRQMPVDAALKRLRALPGVGPYYAQGILHRGAGLIDDNTDDDITKEAVKKAYGLKALPTHTEVLERAGQWQRFRMWVNVLLHVWYRRAGQT